MCAGRRQTGAIGIAGTFAYDGSKGRKLAEHRQVVMQEFLNEFMIEWEGEKGWKAALNSMKWQR